MNAIEDILGFLMAFHKYLAGLNVHHHFWAGKQNVLEACEICLIAGETTPKRRKHIDIWATTIIIIGSIVEAILSAFNGHIMTIKMTPKKCANYLKTWVKLIYAQNSETIQTQLTKHSVVK